MNTLLQFVVVNGVQYYVETQPDEDGYFFCSDNDGFTHEFHYDQVDSESDGN